MIFLTPLFWNLCLGTVTPSRGTSNPSCLVIGYHFLPCGSWLETQSCLLSSLMVSRSVRPLHSDLQTPPASSSFFNPTVTDWRAETTALLQMLLQCTLSRLPYACGKPLVLGTLSSCELVLSIVYQLKCQDLPREVVVTCPTSLHIPVCFIHSPTPTPNCTSQSLYLPWKWLFFLCTCLPLLAQPHSPPLGSSACCAALLQSGRHSSVQQNHSSPSASHEGYPAQISLVRRT